jgi:hypothetical protein
MHEDDEVGMTKDGGAWRVLSRARLTPLIGGTLLLAALLSMIAASKAPDANESPRNPPSFAPQEEPRGIGPVDPSGAFFVPDFALHPGRIVIATGAGELDGATYLRYLGALLGPRYLEDLAFDHVLTLSCREAGLVPSAPTMARSLATQRFVDGGRRVADDPDGSVRRKFATQALRRLRVDALVGLERAADMGELRSRFDHRFGTGGVRVRIRQIVVSFVATGRRLGVDDQDAIRKAAEARARSLRERLRTGEPFEDLLRESDDRVTRQLLRDPSTAAGAGVVDGYNWDRYGNAYAGAVRALAKEGVTEPVPSTVGYHLVQLLDRKTTEFASVQALLAAELRTIPATATEERSLREALFEKYGVRIKP